MSVALWYKKYPDSLQKDKYYSLALIILNLENSKPLHLVLAQMKPVIPLKFELVAPKLCHLLLDVPGAGPQLHEGVEGGLDTEDTLQQCWVELFKLFDYSNS